VSVVYIRYLDRNPTRQRGLFILTVTRRVSNGSSNRNIQVIKDAQVISQDPSLTR
jgi:hypothetical protein